jgi:hypothetical protein
VNVRPEPASFRDPSGAVLYAGDHVLRGLDATAAEDWKALSTSRLLERRMADGSIVGTEVAKPATLADTELEGFAVVLAHERIPLVSYPYEWTFEMLRDAAVVHLEMLLDALDENLTTKDGYAYNMQWRGSKPVFIDIGSFERLQPGLPWAGYRQFCQTFLYPLLLQAYLEVPFQRYLLGSLEGLEASEVRRLLGGRNLARKGVLRHVHLQAMMQSRVTAGTESTKRELAKAGFSKELTRATLKKLLELVQGLKSKRSMSGWASYRTTCSYSDDDTAAKESFVTEIASDRRPALAWDLGCNDGWFSRLVAEHADQVVALDGDDVVVDALYQSLRKDGPANILPLVMDLVDPSPSRGWRLTERKAFTDRSQPDLVLALALVHHLSIGSNIPLDQVVDWFRSLGSPLLIEFVDRHDPMAKRLLGNKPAQVHESYTKDNFEKALSGAFTVDRRLDLPSGRRTLYFALPT